MAVARNTRQEIDYESGSLVPLTSGLFLVLLILSLGIVNLGDSYLGKRELIQIAEAAAQVGAHQLELKSYYGDGASQALQVDKRIPIDCSAAQSTVDTYIRNSNLRGEGISLAIFGCHENQVDIGLTSSIAPVVSFPIFVKISGGRVPVRAEVSAVSVFGNQQGE